MKKKSRIRVKSIIYLSIMAIILACGCGGPSIQPVDFSEPINGDILYPPHLDDDSRDIAIHFKDQICVDSNWDRICTEVTQENEDALEPDLLLIGNKLTFRDELGNNVAFTIDWIEFDPPVLEIIPDGPFTTGRTYTIWLRSARDRAIRYSAGGPWATMDFVFSFKTRGPPDGTKPTLKKFSVGGVTISSPSSSEFINFSLPPNMDIVAKFSEEMNFSLSFIINPEIGPENLLNFDSITSNNITFTLKLTGLDIGEDFYFKIVSTGDGVAGLPIAAVAVGEEDFWEEAHNTLKGLFGADFEIANPLDDTGSFPPGVSGI